MPMKLRAFQVARGFSKNTSPLTADSSEARLVEWFGSQKLSFPVKPMQRYMFILQNHQNLWLSRNWVYPKVIHLIHSVSGLPYFQTNQSVVGSQECWPIPNSHLISFTLHPKTSGHRKSYHIYIYVITYIYIIASI